MSRYIDADKLNPDCMFNKNGTRGFAISQSQIANAPTADVQPVIHGKWINHTHTNGLGITFIDYECDACHEHIDTWKSDYCPNCGAKMAEPQESEDKDDTD